MPNDNIEIFISYSKQDKELRDGLLSHLHPLEREGIITWHDRQILPGTEWDDEIRARLNAADIILLLISADFLATDYCTQVEIPEALRRHQTNDAIVMPVILRSCSWQYTPLAKIQAYPEKAKPIKSWSDIDEAYTNVVDGVYLAATEIKKRRNQQHQAQEQQRQQLLAQKEAEQPITRKAFPFRQMRDGHQQPYIDELKRLEAQAERINQLLAERKRKRAQAEQAVELTDGAPEPFTLAPQKRSVLGSGQTFRSLQREVSSMPAQDDDTVDLEAQAERIKQFLEELEVAIIEGEMAPQDSVIETISVHDQPRMSHSSAPAAQPPTSDVESFMSGTYRYGAKTPPFETTRQSITHSTDQKAQQEQQRQEEARKKQTAQAVRTNELASEKGVDYTRLRDLLKAGQWSKADHETERLMCEVMGRQNEVWLRVGDIQVFPCTDLHTIDKLWLTHSQGKFGFSVQIERWQKCGSPIERNADWEKFGEAVGWKKKGFLGWSKNWKGSAELTFSVSAHDGHLPALTFRWWGLLGLWFYSLASRLGKI